MTMHPETNGAAKLGLALSGGGFRATFFHLGVLRRLAELDVLRHVDVISSVSGGSILGAHYMLRLKERRETSSAGMSTADYVDVVRQMEEELREGIHANLRSRLFLDPLQNLRMIVRGDSLGVLMASFYNRYLYGGGGGRGILLRDMRFKLEGERVDSGIDRFNRSARDKVPTLVLNATSLNSGRPFRLTFVEIGDPQMGFLREDESDVVERYRRLLGPVPPHGAGMKSPEGPEEPGGALAAHLAWWRLAERLANDNGDLENRFRSEEKIYAKAVSALPPDVRAVTDRLLRGFEVRQRGDHIPPWETARRLLAAEPGTLRRAKLAAWHLRNAAWESVDRSGGYTREDHRRRFWDAIEDIDGVIGLVLEEAFRDGAGEDGFLAFILDLYYFRSARVLAPGAGAVFDRLTLADAVAMSANFPPVFSPYRIGGVYDAAVARALSLTDGGVHDNQGIDALLDEGCTHVIASDAGGLLPLQSAPSHNRVAMMLRIGSILTDCLRGLQLSALRERRRVTKGIDKMTGPSGDDDVDDLKTRYDLDDVAFFHMLSSPHDAAPLEGEAVRPHPDAEAIAKLRTDLDVFGAVEIDALFYQGYQLADRFVRTDKYMDRATGFVTYVKADPPALPGGGEARAWEKRVLEAGHRRFGRLLVIYPALRRTLAVLGVVAGAVLLRWCLTHDGGVYKTDLLPPGATRMGRTWSPIVAFVALAFVVWKWSPFGFWRRNAWWLAGLALAFVWGGVWWIVGVAPLWLALLGMLFSLALLGAGRITDRVTSRRNG